MKPRHIITLLSCLLSWLVLASLPNDMAAVASSSYAPEDLSSHPPITQSEAQGSPTRTPTPTPSSTITATPTSICPLVWRVVPSQNLSGANTLYSVAGITPNDVWAVGAGGPNHTLMQHWNGTQWTLASPTPLVGFNERLNSVSAVASNDVWAVGWYEGSTTGTLIEHWNGTQWANVSSPNGSGYYNELISVSARTASDVWAVGFQTDSGGTNHTLTLHWNGSAWSVIPSPDGPVGSSQLYGVTSVFSTDVWAVGSYTSGQSTVPLILHWDGTAWSVATIPSFSQPAYLRGISGRSGNDLWAVGAYPGQGGYQTLTMHYNGEQWSIVPSPSPGDSNSLAGVDVTGPSNAWAVGSYTSAGQTQGLILHWDGSAWSVSSNPSPSPSSNLWAITTVRFNDYDVWAVGYTGKGTDARTLTEHYSYTGCSTPTPTGTPPPISTHTPTFTPVVTPTPCTEDYTYTLASGSIISGTTLLSGSQCGQCVVPLALPFPFSFYGQTYTTANVASKGNLQFTTADTSANSCPPNYPQLGPAILPNWDDSIDMAQTIICQSITGRPCGIYTSVSGSAPNQILHIEWLGRRSGSNTYIINFELRLYEGTNLFDFVYGAINPPGLGGYISSIGIQDGLGRFINYACHVATSIHQGLLISWNPAGCEPTVTPTPTSITTSTSTVTPTRQVTATPTACTITFTDVDENNVFYPFIRCLACRGILSGYDDGTFRPFNDITRGQIAKVVSNAAGFSEDPGAQIYEDVPEGSPFYAWINRLSMRGHIGGYPCGLLPEEPCIEPANLPYFRPSNSATRGQLAKIVANAAELSGAPTGVFYTDVPEEHPFYLWIMRLTELGVMSGYECGGEGEPCDDQDRPYFRPYNNVTRGQASKIVANTFLPSCQTSAR